jgi:hypothetical protein
MKGAWAVLFLLLCVSSALAQTPALKARLAHQDPAQHPCAADIAHFCSAVPSGMGRKWACLRQHRPKLQARCTKLLAYIDSTEARLAAGYHETVEQFRAEEYGSSNAGAAAPVNAPPKPQEPAPKPQDPH